jgi:phytoene synthase
MTSTYDPRSIIRRHSGSLSLAARFLSPLKRQRAESLYAWCRAADDAIDHAPNARAAAIALETLREGLDLVYRGGPIDDPALCSLRHVVIACDIPRSYPEAMLTGMAMDAANTRYESVADLLLYCHRVAGVVGLMMCHALGISNTRALPHAAHLGIAMQLTNIARDVAEDWSNGRLYLPLAWLERLPSSDQALEDAIVAPVIRRLLVLADQYYRSGDFGFRYLEPRSRAAVRMARSVYAAIGTRVAKQAFCASEGRAVVPNHEKLRLVLMSVMATLTEKPSHRLCEPASPLGVWEFRPLEAILD